MARRLKPSKSTSSPTTKWEIHQTKHTPIHQASSKTGLGQWEIHSHERRGSLGILQGQQGGGEESSEKASPGKEEARRW